MNIELFGKQTMVYGRKGTGKSNWTHHVLTQPQYASHVVYDLTREHGDDDCNRVIPEHRKGEKAKEEFSGALKALVTENDRDMRPDLFVGEEISRYAPNQGKTPEALMDFIDLLRHYGTGFIGVARRPAKVEPDLTELADQLVIFRVTGKNDKRRLNNEAAGLGDAATDLGPYEYLVVDELRNWEVHEPVPEYNTTGKL